MKQTVVFIVVTLALSFTLPVHSVMLEPKTNTIIADTTYCPEIQTALNFTGKIDDPLWQTVAATTKGTRFNLIPRIKGKATQQTEVYTMCDKNNLYIAFKCYESQMEKVVSTMTARDDLIYREDSVELFIDTLGNTTAYYHCIANTLGTQFDEYTMGTSDKWTGDWKVLTNKTSGYWTSEFVIPWTTLGIKFERNKIIGINFCRNELPGKETSTWSPLYNRFNEPSNFGAMIIGRHELDTGIEAKISGIRDFSAGKDNIVNLIVKNTSSASKTLLFSASFTINNVTKQLADKTFTVKPGQSESLSAGYTPDEIGPQKVQLQIVDKATGDVILLKNVSFNVSPLALSNYGYVLPSNPDITAWWCENTYKVGKFRDLPAEKALAVKIYAAGNEREHFQLVLHGKKKLENIKISAAALTGPDGAVIPNNCYEIKVVSYVYVHTPTDIFGSVGSYPDPLPLHTAPFGIEPNENQPVWFTINVPEDAKPGVYKTIIKIVSSNTAPLSVPVELKVRRFALTKETHTPTAYGIWLMTERHGAKTQEQVEKVYENYWENYSRHRISPYDPFIFHPIKKDIKKLADGTYDVKLDFTDFDNYAEKVFNEYRFTAFNLGFDTVPEKLGEETRFSDAYKKLHKQVYGGIVDHLREKGWLEKAYCYWIDEPHPGADYELAEQGYELLKQNCPGLRRVLTETHEKSPSPTFTGMVDLWVPITNRYSHDLAEPRQAVGEEVWCYVCTGPRAPYPNVFVDHPAINHRIIFWQMQKYNITGSLYWTIGFWNHGNPWLDPLSYSKDDKSGNFGNGDGRLVYPPRVEEHPADFIDSGPVDSIRWELVSKGIEDREYFWILNRELARVKKLNRTDSAVTNAIRQAGDALELPNKLSRTMTDFEKDPQKLYAAREFVANMIESLMDIQ
ncbi:MAG: glycoside hydrolase domain-containing protein [Elusimicrobiota bacterium]